MNGDFPILRNYLAILREQVDDAPIAVLHIGADHTSLVWGDNPEKYSALRLAAGSRKTAGDHFRHSPPLPTELENAIAAVGDEIMRRRVTFAMRPTVYSVDPEVIDLARLAGVAGETLSVETVEGLYERLAAVSLGRPAAQEPLPLDAAVYATVLVLRELMQHLGYTFIVLRAA